MAIGAALALPWYGPRLFGLPMQILNRSFKQAAEQQNLEPLTGAALLYYPLTLPTQLGLLAGLLLLWGLWRCARTGAARPLLWLATSGPCVAFSLDPEQEISATPCTILPAAALVAAVGLRPLPATRGGGSPVGSRSFSVSSRSPWRCSQIPTPPTLPGMILPLALGRAPSRADWQHDRILADIGRESSGRPVTVAVIPNDNFFSVSNLRHEVVKRGLPYGWMTRAWSDAPFGGRLCHPEERRPGPGLFGGPTRAADRAPSGEAIRTGSRPSPW